MKETVAPTKKHAPSTGRKDFDVFLSYGSTDAETARKLKMALEKLHISVWMDQAQIAPGQVFARALEQGVASSSGVVFLISPESATSKWVQEEYYSALTLANSSTRQIHIIPVRLRDPRLPPFLASRQAIDIRNEVDIERAAQQILWGLGSSGSSAVALVPEDGSSPKVDKLALIAVTLAILTSFVTATVTSVLNPKGQTFVIVILAPQAPPLWPTNPVSPPVSPHNDPFEPSIELPVRDNHNRTGRFVLDIVHKEFYWKEGNSRILLNGHSLEELFAIQAVRNKLAETQIVVCVGTASRKGADRKKQEELAALRASELAAQARHFTNLQSIHMLTVGQFSAHNQDSLLQRPVVLIRSVGPIDPNLDLEEAINNGLKDKSRTDKTVESLIGDYSLNKKGKVGIFR
jgi:hypothetical protein